MQNFIHDQRQRMKGEHAAKIACCLLGISAVAMAPFAAITSQYLLPQSALLFIAAVMSKLLLYAMPAISLLLYLEFFYKTKRHTPWFLILGSVATAAQLVVIVLNWGEFILGFSSDTFHLLFAISLILLVIQPLVTLVCFLTELNVAFPRIACLLTVASLLLYGLLAILAGYETLALLSLSYLLYSIGLFIAIPKIVDFEREHGHYIHHT